MLKIREDVDLKELEEFGFKEKNTSYCKEYKKWYEGQIYVEKSDKQLHCYTEDDDSIILDTVYDLIKADMVVKDE